MSGEAVPIDLKAFLAALGDAGCQPRQIGPATWVAVCPACRAEGRFSLMTIRWLPDGVDVDACEGWR